MSSFRFFLSFFRRWLSYYFRARTIHDVHSPFVFRLTEEVLENKRQYYTFSVAERLRWKLLNNQTSIEVSDYGAGSMISNSPVKTIKTIAQNAAIKHPQGQQLFNLVRLGKPQNILELGTSLGISTVYQAGAAPYAKFLTLEGCPNTATIAKNNLRSLGLEHIEVIPGTFADNLDVALQKLGKVDFIFIDGDHQENSTLKYFDKCLPYLHNDSLVVIADIHWSEPMEDAWKQLTAREEVRISIDFFHFGLLYFRKENRTKQDFTLIQYKYKPWRLGFFQ